MKRILFALVLLLWACGAWAQPVGLIVGATPVIGGSTGNCLTITSGQLTAGACGGSGVTTFSAGTTGLTPNSATSGAVTLAGVLVGTNGGTGVNNGASTITIGGNVAFSGAFGFTGTLSGTTGVTFPTSGTLAILGANTFTANQSHASGTNINWNGDTILVRDGANMVALQNSTNPQTLRLYNTFTDASNFERGGLTWSSGSLILNTSNAGTGSARGISIQAANGATTFVGSVQSHVFDANNFANGGTAGTVLTIISNGTGVIQFASSGAVIPNIAGLRFASGAAAVPDANINRIASGVLGVGTGAAGSVAGTLSGTILATAGTVQYLGTTAGSATAYTVSPTPAITTLTSGACFYVKFNQANSGAAPTLAVSATAATAIVKRASTALAANDITANAIGNVCFDGTSYELLNPVVN